MKQLIIILIMMISSLKGSAQNVIDVHCHNIPQFYTDVLENNGAALDEGYPLPAWSAEKHLAFMDSAGIRCSVLTMPAPQPYFGGGKECRDVVRKYNEHCAELKAKHPGRFLFCASLPLPDVKAAIDEAIYALDTLEADGVKLPTNSRGLYLGDKELEPLMEVLNSRKAVIIIHPHKPVPVNEKLMAQMPLAAYEYPAETTRALMNMLAANLPARYPQLKIVVPHCGSFLPLALPRLKALAPALKAGGYIGDIDIKGCLSQLYYDLAGAPSAEVIRSLLTITSPGHILYGSDYPYQPAEVLTANLRRLDKELKADKTLSEYRDMFMWKNAARLFNIADAGSTEADNSATPEKGNNGKGMLVRISKIEIYPEYFNEYITAAMNVGATSVREEPGVIAIFPMIQQRDSCQVRILEIYADMDAYRHHITTAHFNAYKQGTLHMVKSLDLVDMTPMNAEAMDEIFSKMKKE